MQRLLILGLIAIGACADSPAAGAQPPKNVPAPVAAAPTAPSIYADPTMRAWSRLFIEKNYNDLIASIEGSLRSASPHPLAPYCWANAHQTWGRLADAIDRADDALKARLGVLPGVLLLYETGRYGLALERHPIAGAASINDAMALTYLARCAIGEVRIEDAALYAARAIELRPELFHPVWVMIDLLGEDDEVDRKVAAMFAPDTALGKTEAGSLVGVLAREQLWLEDKYVRSPTMVAHLRAWLARHPDDMIARYCLAVTLRSCEVRGEPETLFLEEAEAFPFGARGTRATAALLDTDRQADAVRLILFTSPYADGTSDGAQRMIAERLARGAVEGGLLGKAREVLEKALERWPDDGPLNAIMAGIEADSGRHDYAVPYARKAALARPDNFDYSTTLMNCLVQSRAMSEAIKVADAAADEAAVNGRGKTTIDWYRMRSQAYVAASNRAVAEGDKKAEADLDRTRLQLLERAVRHYPRSTRLLRELADAQMAVGKNDDAIASIGLALRVQPAARSPLDWLLEKVEQKSGQAGATKALDAMRAERPYIKLLWTLSAKRLGDDGPAIESLWNQAVAANPGRSWAVEELVEHLISSGQWDRARQAAANLVAPSKAARAGDRTEALRIMTDVARRHARIEPLTEQGMAPLLQMLEEYRTLQGPLSVYHLARAHLFEARADLFAAGKEMILACASDPSWERPAKELAERYAPFVGRGAAMQAYYRHLQRDPYDGSRAWTYSNYHATWSGSPVEALRWSRHLKQIGSADYDKATEAAALGRLGDKRRRFEIEYAGGKPFSATWRYVLAYHDARLAAEKAAPITLHVDTETGVVNLVQEDGSVTRFAYHPLSGQVLWREIGAVRVEAQYGPCGDRRTGLSVKGQCEFRIGYQGESINSRIDRIEMVGVGTLVLAFNAVGDETSRTVEPATGAGGDLEKLRSRIEDSYLAARRALEGDDLVSVFDLLKADRGAVEFRQRALTAIGAAKADKTVESKFAAWNARLALASYLIDHGGEDPRYRDEAAETAAVAFDEARDLGTDEAIRVAVRALLTKHRVLMEFFPDGLPADQWRNWMIWRDWLTSVVPTRGDKIREIAEAARRIEQQPPVPTESAQWLPRSDLVNQGFWRRHPISTILPRALGDRVTLDTAVMRFNDDVVVGTSMGLAVFRRGFWQWYGFDEKTGRFSGTLDPRDVKPSSAVLSLSEDQDSVLWIGTANGLIRMAGLYDDAVERWVTPYDGLPVPRVDHLVGYGPGAVVGTSRGARIFGEGLPPLPGAMARAEVLFAHDVDVSYDIKPIDFEKLCADMQIKPALLDKGARAEAEDRLTAGKPMAPWLRSLNPGKLKDKTDEQVEKVLVDGYSEEKKQVRIRRTLLLGTSAGLFAMTGREWVRLLDGEVDDVAWDVGLSRLWVLRDRTLYVMTWNGKGEGSALHKVGGQQEIRNAGRIYGIQPMFFRSPEKDRDLGIGMLTDNGLLLYYKGHFENFNLPQGLADRRPVVRDAATLGKTWNLVTSEGLYSFEDSRVQRQTGGQVHDLISIPQWKRTFVAWGDSIGAVDYADSRMTAAPFSKDAATRLAADALGRLVTHDGNRVIRYEVGAAEPRVLFEAVPTIPADARELVRDWPITAILVDSAQRIWACAGPALFCWQEGKPVVEFSMFVDSARFPSQSSFIVNVVEIEGAGVYAVASNESPKTFRLVPLNGGLLSLKPDGQSFERLGDSLAAVDFFSASTRIDPDTTILGSGGGFSMYRAGNHSSFDALGNSSYRRLKQRPMTMWLGTRGARVGDVWLFGSSGGVAAFRRGQWFYPDRLNWMLPDQHLAAYGARHVHAVAADPEGRIYVGTDRGLTVYNPGGGDATSFLVSNGFEDQAFDIVNERRQQEMRDTLLGTLQNSPGVDPEVRDTVALRRQIDALQQDLDYVVGVGRTRGGSGGAVETAEADSPRAEEIRKAIREKQKQLLDQIGKLRARFPELMESLKIQPRDLALKRDRLPENYVVVQFIASPNDLNILLTSRHLNEIVKVKVTQQELLDRVQRVTEALRKPPENGQQYKPEGRETLEDLAWLYEQLMRPIEQYLPEDARVMIIPDRTFASIPFGSLVRLREDKNTFDYAMQLYYLGVLHTPEQLQAALDRAASTNTDALIVADPDGSLAEARKEAADVHDLLKAASNPLLGAQATLAAIEKGIPSARTCHIATHAVLNSQAPDKSYLLLADGQRLDMAGCMTLPFHGTRLVVLSACQTGVGSVSLEFDTLANAFAAAGVTTTVASLWRVGDEATHRLMTAFYTHLSEGKDAVVALTEAQREMHRGEDKGFKSPRAWAGFAVWGKP